MSRSTVWGRAAPPEVLVFSDYNGGYTARLPIEDSKHLAEVKRRLRGLYVFRSPSR